MDPNATLAELLADIERWSNLDELDNMFAKEEMADSIVQHILNLDVWFRKGGTLPERWNPLRRLR